MKILVTGVSGFFGVNFYTRFNKKYEIIGIDKRSPPQEFPNLTFYRVNILSVPRLYKVFKEERPDKVVHFAAQSHINESLLNPIETYRNNVIGTINLLHIAKKMNITQFIYISSDIIYGKAKRYPCKENHSINPDNPYAASKAAGDFLTQNITGIRCAVLRPGLSFGPWSDPMSNVVAKFLWNVIHDKPLLFPADKNIKHPTRDINYIENTIDGIELAIEKNAYGVYNIGSGREISILDLAEKIINITGKGKIVFDPNFKYRFKEIGMRTWLDINKAQTELGYRPKVSLEDGLKKTYEWMLKNLSRYE